MKQLMVIAIVVLAAVAVVLLLQTCNPPAWSYKVVAPSSR